MRLPYRPLPGLAADIERPLLDVHVEGIEVTAVACLLDTGAVGNRFGAWVAEAAGIELDTAPADRVLVAGLLTVGRVVPVTLRVDEYEWTTDVSFCEPWPWDFHILGQEGFFRYFQVCFDAAALSVDVEPARQ